MIINLLLVYFNIIMAAGILPPQRTQRLFILFYYSKVCEGLRTAFRQEEPGVLMSTKYSWGGARLDSTGTY